MFFITSKILAFLSKPITWIFIMLTCAIIFKKNSKRILYSTLFIFYVFTNNFIADSFSRYWEIPRFNPVENYDVGIVLGGISEYDQSTKAHNFNQYADRLMDAEQLYHQGIINKIMLSGGNGSIFQNKYIEADAIKTYLLKKNIPNQDILIENTSKNTKENALNSSVILKKIFPNGDFLLITSAQHMRRAKYCFDKTNIKITSFSTDCTNSKINLNIEYLLMPQVEALKKWETLFHEWIGYIVYRIII